MRKICCLLVLFFSDCSYSYREVEGFHSDYTVYAGELISENLGNYTVKYVDLDKIKDNPGKTEQVKDQYLLYLNDTAFIHVSPDHPKKNLPLIMKFYDLYKSDSTYLDEIEIEKNKASITVNKKRSWIFKSWYTGDTIAENRTEFVPWKDILFQKEQGVWKLTKSQFNYFWPKK